MQRFIIFLLCISLFDSFGQQPSKHSKKVQKLFEEAKTACNSKLFTHALTLLDEAILLDSAYLDLYLLKSDVCQDMDSVLLQIKSLDKAIQIGQEKYPKLYYSIGNACYRAGLYKKALKSFNTYLELAGESGNFAGNARQNIQKASFALWLQDHPVPYQSQNLGSNVNTNDDEYWPSLTVDGKTLIFTRLTHPSQSSPQKHVSIQEDFYVSHFTDGQWMRSEPLLLINTEDNEGAQSVSTDGLLIFFTACNRVDALGSCDLYFSKLSAGKWSQPQNVGSPVNSGSWEAQPSISGNGQDLYFVSNRKGGKGGMDIWKSHLKRIDESGRLIWGAPVNLGDSVNTSGNEMSPFIHADGRTLYFASDTWPGMGENDIFYCRMKQPGEWTKPVNIGYPINTHRNEMGLIVDAAGETAYYASDRAGSLGKDIYSFKLYPEARPNQVSYIRGKVVDGKTGDIVAANVELIDLSGNDSVIKTTADENGEFLIGLPVDKEFAFHISATGYLFYSENIGLKEQTTMSDPSIHEFKLKKIELDESVVLNNIFFTTNSSDLLPESDIELKKLIDFMQTNPSISIEIEGHTDSTGGEEWNSLLSDARAKSVYDYLVQNKIVASRLSFKGFGSSKPISLNDTPEGRALNRRTNFRITSR